jgi:hypothetical protein
MTPEEFQRWRFEERLLQDELARLEDAMRAVLRRLRCPTSPVAIYNLLDGDRTWPHRLATRDKPRARMAMFALVELSNVRHRATGLSNGDPLSSVQAASTALRAALLASAVMPRRRSFHLPGSEHDSLIAKYSRLYDADEDLQAEYSSRAAYIGTRLQARDNPPTRRTIQRRLKALKLT